MAEFGIVVNKLSQLKLVESVPNPAHRRSKLIQLTPMGRQVLDQAEEQVFLPVDDSELSIEELSAALRTLRILRAHWLRAGRAGAQTSSEPRPSGEAGEMQPTKLPTADTVEDLPVNLL